MKKPKAVLLAVAPVVCALQANLSRAAAPAPVIDLAALADVGRVQITVFDAIPINPPPVNGFIPRVIYTLTDEQVANDFTFATYASNSPGGNYLNGGTPYYASAIFDTGA